MVQSVESRPSIVLIHFPIIFTVQIPPCKSLILNKQSTIVHNTY